MRFKDIIYICNYYNLKPIIVENKSLHIVSNYIQFSDVPVILWAEAWKDLPLTQKWIINRLHYGLSWGS